VVKKFLTQMPTRFAVAKGPVKLNSIIVDIDEDTGKSLHIQRLNITEE
jgi:calcineurin-like phosphoesterase